MAPDPNREIFEVWNQQPDKHVLLVDEVRFSRNEVAQHGQTVLFAVVCTRARTLVSTMVALRAARDAFTAQRDRPRFKGRRIFAKPAKPRYRRHRVVIGGAIFDAELVLRYATTTDYLADAATSPTRLTDGTTISGEEFPLLLLILKEAANRLNAGEEVVDVLVDRSTQLGIHPQQHGITTEQFQMYVAPAGSLNTTTVGTRATVTSPSGFRIIAIGEETLELGDVLLLPDSAAYLSRAIGIPLLGDPRLRSGVVPFEPVTGRDFFALS